MSSTFETQEARCLDSAISHSMLVALAGRWLRKTCAVVITELATTGETPDAIGWPGSGTQSTLVECKCSRSDFLADRGKWFRREHWRGVGIKRYFLALPGIIKADELPEKWGLLEVTASKVRVVRESEHFTEVNNRQEIGILISTLRRVGKDAPEGTSIACYTIATKNRATLAVEAPSVGDGNDEHLAAQSKQNPALSPHSISSPDQKAEAGGKQC